MAASSQADIETGVVEILKNVSRRPIDPTPASDLAADPVRFLHPEVVAGVEDRRHLHPVERCRRTDRARCRAVTVSVNARLTARCRCPQLEVAAPSQFPRLLFRAPAFAETYATQTCMPASGLASLLALAPPAICAIIVQIQRHDDLSQPRVAQPRRRLQRRATCHDGGDWPGPGFRAARARHHLSDARTPIRFARCPDRRLSSHSMRQGPAMEPAERRRPATPRSSNSSGSTATPKGVAITHQNLSGTSPPSLR